MADGDTYLPPSGDAAPNDDQSKNQITEKNEASKLGSGFVVGSRSLWTRLESPGRGRARLLESEFQEHVHGFILLQEEQGEGYLLNLSFRSGRGITFANETVFLLQQI